MADLGTLQTIKHTSILRVVVDPAATTTMKKAGLIVQARDPIYDWMPGTLSEYSASPVGSLGGYVKQNGVPITACKVTLFRRADSQVVARVFTDAAGAFTFTRIPLSMGPYFAVAFDPDGDPLQNSLILDYLTPT